MELTRREAIAAAAAAVATSAIAQPPTPSSLNSIARKSGRRFGSAVAWAPPDTDTGSITNLSYTASSPGIASCWCRRTNSNGSGCGDRRTSSTSRRSMRSPTMQRKRLPAARPHALLDADQMVSQVACREAFRISFRG